MNEPLTDQQRRIHAKLQSNLKYFCARAVFIKAKAGGMIPFIWNKAQQYLHDRIEDQLRRTGMVRMAIIKGRQQGISTYLQNRIYHKTTRNKGLNAFTLSHHATTTETLYQIMEKTHENCPAEIKPSSTTNNRRQMRFENGSQYTVGTAGSGAIGRGETNQLFHGSEVAFYENTDDIQTGVMQTVADVPGTEVYLESTANGIGNYFHKVVMDALEGKGSFEVVFIPWFWQDEYRLRIPDNERAEFQLTDEEETLVEAHGLDEEQIYWRRNKISFFKSEWKFKQEYPCTIREAFQSSGISLLDPDTITRARKSSLRDASKPVVIGADPARKGDRTVITIRQGRHILKIIKYNEMDEMRLVGILSRLIDQYQATKCFVDVAMGYGTIDRLHELGYHDIVTGVHFGEKPINDEVYYNKRAEMAGDFRDWLKTPGGVNIPDDEEVEVDYLAIPDFKITSNNLLQLESKDNIKKKFGKSPDIFDSTILTFAYPVRSEVSVHRRQRYTENTKRGSVLRARRTQVTPPKPVDHDDFDGDKWTRPTKRLRR